MLEQLDALRALHETGTTAGAAARLRVTQSAISKRIAALEARVGWPLTERVGRNVRLRSPAIRLLEEVTPLLIALEERLSAAATPDVPTVRIAAAESMISSWLAPVLRSAATEAGVQIELHAHRGLNVLARLRAGEVDLAIANDGDGDASLVVEEIGREPMVLVAPGGGALPSVRPVPVCTIEASSLTGAWLDRQLRRRGDELVVVRRIESFAAALGLARGGFETALVPAGVAIGLLSTPIEGLSRPVVVSSRPTARARPAVAALVAAIVVQGGRALNGMRSA